MVKRASSILWIIREGFENKIPNVVMPLLRSIMCVVLLCLKKGIAEMRKVPKRVNQDN